jgi:hypothetical protein
VSPYEYAWAFVSALAGDPNRAIIDWRALHDTDKSDKGHARRGTLPEWWSWLEGMNSGGYGIFCTIAEMDGFGRELGNVAAIRAHYVDLDNLSADQNYARAAAWTPAPCFAVDTSPSKHHVYWPTAPYRDNDRFQLVQRKLRQLFDGDKRVIDAARVMRLPGTYNMKRPEAPFLVTCHALPGYLQPTSVEALEAALAGINVIDGGNGERFPLGEPSMAAPSLEWIAYGLQLLDPNDLDRGEWIAITSAVKQAGWTFGEHAVRRVWEAWCARYTANDPGENEKQWSSIRNTELGWPSLTRRIAGLRVALDNSGIVVASPTPAPVAAPDAMTPPPVQAAIADAIGVSPPSLDCSGEFLTHVEQQQWFKGCVFVVKEGKILAPDGRFLNATQFNGAYGGKRFIITSGGKDTDEPFKAALRSTMWTIPKVDHVRFVPHEPHGAIITDELGRAGVNMYKPAMIKTREGDPSPFLNHLAAILPVESDREILIKFLAHNAKYPGHKIPWAPVIQSAEGVGKGVLKALMMHALGRPYVYFPNAQELTTGGSKFNGWLRNRLFILADEIKVDDKRDLIEVLKPLISEVIVEMQNKGIDQDMDDNFANWLFFTNYKDAVPVSKNGRRYAIFYSPLQTEAHLLAMGMGEEYFNAMYRWLDEGGAAIVTHYLLNYPIERGAIPMRAPKTSSWDEAVKISRTPIERVIQEALEDQLPGFRGGWISVASATKRIKEQGALRGNAPPHAITSTLESLGYVKVGRTPRAYQQEEFTKSDLYHFGGWADVAGFGVAQGWD